MNAKQMAKVKEMEKVNGIKASDDHRPCHNRRDAKNCMMRRNPRKYYKQIVKNSKKGV